MADFSADITQMREIAGRLQGVKAKLDDAVSAIEAGSNRIGANPTLGKLGYASMTQEVAEVLSSYADGVKSVASKVSEASDLYEQYEARVIGAPLDLSGNASSTSVQDSANNPFWDFIKGDAKLSGALIAGEIAGQSTSLTPAFKAAWDKTIGSYKDAWDEAGDSLDDFRKWRSTKGSELVESVEDLLRDVPLVGGILENTTEYLAQKWGKKAKKYEEIFDGIQAVGSLSTSDATTVDTVVKGFSAFSNEALGIPNLYALKEKYVVKGSERIANQYKSMLAQGKTKSEAMAYAAADTVLTIGELAADTVFQFGKFGVKTVAAFTSGGLSVAKYESINTFSGAVMGKSVEDAVDGYLGNIGNTLRSGLKSFAHLFA